MIKDIHRLDEDEVINPHKVKEEKRYPIAEIFTSWQGEGLWAGTRMTFIRFAGCNVGKPIVGDIVTEFDSVYGVNDLPEPMRKYKQDLIPIWQEECTSWDNRKFLCDTDFRVKERLTAKEIMDRVPKDVEHIVFTGGEPLIHDLSELSISWFQGYKHRKHTLHIETSGTRSIFDTAFHLNFWVTVSPKINCLTSMIIRADEVKLLVDEYFDEKKAEELTNNINGIVWLSSINGINSLDKSNMDKCKEIAERHSTWRITQQAHKIWCVR